MYNMHSSSRKKLSKIKALGFETGIASILATVIDAEIVKTKTSFLAFWNGDIWWSNVFFDHSSSKWPGLGFS